MYFKYRCRPNSADFFCYRRAAFINEEYIDLRDFLFNPKVNIQKIVFYIQDQTFEKMSPINYRKQ